MLIEKEVIGPATHWYRDQKTGVPRKLVVTPELTKYWHDQGNQMLSVGLTVPVPCEHDFDAHPMTPADKLKNNAGWVKEYRLGSPKKDGSRADDNKLFAVVNIEDEEIAKKLPKTIRWTSPWINSFTDGQNRNWNNVISHLALTTRPRIVDQAPFGSIAAALSLATETKIDPLAGGSFAGKATDGLLLSRAGKLVHRKRDGKLRPQYPIAFSIFSGGVALANDDLSELDDSGADKKPKSKKKPPAKKGKKDPAGGNPAAGADDSGSDDAGDDFGGDDADDDSTGIQDSNQLLDQAGDVKMEELLCDLLNALGVQMPDNVGESEFNRALYEATMAKIKELAMKGLSAGDANAAASGANTASPAGNQGNPIIQQEQQPMYMSLEEINKITDQTMKGIALSMYNENVKLRGELDADRKVTASLRDSKLKEENAKRSSRVQMLGKLSPKVKADLDAMLALPVMALSMGDGGDVVDPMAQTIAVLEKGLADMPRLLTTDAAALSITPHPSDGEMTQEATDQLADSLARQMGCPPERKAG